MSDVLSKTDTRAIALENHRVCRPANDAHWPHLPHASFGQDRRCTQGQTLRLAIHFGHSLDRKPIGWLAGIESPIDARFLCRRD